MRVAAGGFLSAEAHSLETETRIKRKVWKDSHGIFKKKSLKKKSLKTTLKQTKRSDQDIYGPNNISLTVANKQKGNNVEKRKERRE